MIPILFAPIRWLVYAVAIAMLLMLGAFAWFAEKVMEEPG